MKRLKRMILVAACAVFAGCVGENPAFDDSPVLLPDDAEIEQVESDVVEKRSYAELERENAALKKENRRLRRELVRQSEDKPKIDLSQVKESQGVPGEETNGKATDDGGYWLATEKMRRHNSKCKYYKLGRGRPCQKNEGTPCKRCGG